jgi:uncharacterized surface protein with fasciclin (FAS1) repeats
MADNANLTLVGGELLIDNAAVVVTDVQASNGIIHVIDMVIVPPSD